MCCGTFPQKRNDKSSISSEIHTLLKHDPLRMQKFRTGVKVVKELIKTYLTACF